MELREGGRLRGSAGAELESTRTILLTAEVNSGKKRNLLTQNSKTLAYDSRSTVRSCSLHSPTMYRSKDLTWPGHGPKTGSNSYGPVQADLWSGLILDQIMNSPRQSG